MGKQIIHGYGGASAIHQTSINYAGIQGNIAWTADEAGGTMVVAAAGTLRNLTIRLDTAPGAGKSRTFVLRINGVDSGVTVTISDAATTGRDIVNSVAVAAGDKLTLKSTPTGTPDANSVTRVTCEFESTASGESTYARQTTNAGSANIASTNYIQPFAGSAAGTSTAVPITDATAIMPCAGNLTALYARTQSAISSGSFIWSLYKNGVRQDGTGGTVDTVLTIDSTNHAGASKTFTLSVVAGDLISLEVIKSAHFLPTPSWAMRFTATTDGESVLSGGATPATGTTRYHCLANGNSDNNSLTEASVNQDAGVTGYTLGGMRVYAGVAPGAGTSHTFTVRKNSASPASGPVTTLSDTNVEATGTGSVSVVDGDTLGVLAVPSGSPAVDVTWWTLTQTVATQKKATAIFGEAATVTATHTFVANMDAVTRTIALPNTVYLAPNVTIPETIAAPTASADVARFYVEDNGSGKTRLMVRFGSGAAQQIAIEP